MAPLVIIDCAVVSVRVSYLCSVGKIIRTWELMYPSFLRRLMLVKKVKNHIKISNIYRIDLIASYMSQ